MFILYLIGLVQSQSYTNQGSDWTGTCATGQNQSPVDLTVSAGTCDNSMVLDLQFNTSNVTVQIQLSNSLVYSIGDIVRVYATDIKANLYGYQSTSFQFHSPSEHTIDGTQYDLEMQVISTVLSSFSTAPVATAIVSFLFSASSSATQPFFDTYNLGLASTTALNVTKYLPTTTNTTTNTTTTVNTSSIVTINYNTLLGAQLNAIPPYYTYQGSNTSTPCAELVNWYVVSQILPMTTAQLKAIQTFFSANTTFAAGNGNNRMIQKLNSRTILKGGVACEEQFVYFFSFFILYIFINYFIFKLL